MCIVPGDVLCLLEFIHDFSRSLTTSCLYISVEQMFISRSHVRTPSASHCAQILSLQIHIARYLCAALCDSICIRSPYPHRQWQRNSAVRIIRVHTTFQLAIVSTMNVCARGSVKWMAQRILCTVHCMTVFAKIEINVCILGKNGCTKLECNDKILW